MEHLYVSDVFSCSHAAAVSFPHLLGPHKAITFVIFLSRDVAFNRACRIIQP
jgi:hypothetical protein